MVLKSRRLLVQDKEEVDPLAVAFQVLWSQSCGLDQTWPFAQTSHWTELNQNLCLLQQPKVVRVEQEFTQLVGTLASGSQHDLNLSLIQNKEAAEAYCQFLQLPPHTYCLVIGFNFSCSRHQRSQWKNRSHANVVQVFLSLTFRSSLNTVNHYVSWCVGFHWRVCAECQWNIFTDVLLPSQGNSGHQCIERATCFSTLFNRSDVLFVANSRIHWILWRL